ncbi:redox-regulated ATPase YchF [bacterium 3DAC]|nr:redox-regulated ATPase YchF [Dictyoglomota bacterium]UZN22689.1 redox-regulated ATPase YchF [bacterium 3DAC]
MEAGLVGLKYSGKSTIFKALTEHKVQTKEGSVVKGAATVMDERLLKLAEVFHPKKITPATITFVDVPGFTPGMDKKMYHQFLSEVSKVDLLINVVRAFDDPYAPHPLGDIDPVRDATALDEELLLRDMSYTETRLSNRKLDKDTRAILEKILAFLETEKPLRAGEFSDEEWAFIQREGYLTAKPEMYVLNVEDGYDEQWEDALRAYAEEKGAPMLVLNAKLESEIAELPEEERQVFMEEFGITEPAIMRLAKMAMDMMGLSYFFTAGEKEVRAWTIRKGATAVEAAGAIHTDIAKGFIRAEIVRWDDLVKAGGWKEAHNQGLVRLEKKTYVMQDGDVAFFRFNV